MVDVLLVEDEPEHAILVRETWEVGCDWRIARHATSLGAALEAVEQQEFDVVLLDLNLQESRGLDTLHTLHEAHSTLPIIVLTSLEDNRLARAAIRAGAEDYVPKAMLSTDLLGRTIRHALERHRLLKELRETNLRLDDFAALAAHDLVAPLGRITSLIDLLDRQTLQPASHDAIDSLQLIRNECERLASLIISLLGFARLGSRSMQLESTPLTELTLHIVESLSELVKQKQARIDIAEMPSVRVDRSRFGLLLQNIIENALKYQNDDSRPEINISAQQEPGQLRIRVRDNGLGIATEHQAVIFEPFRRLHGDQLSGSGLGLAHCARIVRDHGGTIGVESSSGQGSTFWFTIPTDV
jgi:signal transduction histidine kinase